MTSLKAALELASSRWLGGPGGKVMGTMASTCVAILGEGLTVETLQPPSGTLLLAGLQKRGLSPKSITAYYGAFKRLLSLSGYACTGWPRAPAPPRVKAREPIPEGDLEALAGWLRKAGYVETADLATLMKGTGARINIEVLNEDAMTVVASTDEFDTLRIVGKGGHERYVPVLDPEARAILKDAERMAAIREIRYRGHLTRWSKGVEAVGIKSKLATPHAARHSYATDTHRKSGDLALVQELLGHSSPATTARYITMSMEDKVRRLSSGE